MMRFLQAIALGTLTLLPVACIQQQQQHSKTEKKEKKPAPPIYLGSVHQIYPKINCALLHIIGPMPSPGSTLITHPADGSTARIGNLCVTPEKPTSNGFIMAEIRSGIVMRGDRVFVYRDLTTVQEQEEEDETEQVLQDLAPDLPSNTPVDEGTPATPAPVVHTPVSGTPPATPATPATPAAQPAQPAQQRPSGSQQNGRRPKAPQYLDNIPDDINDWD